MAFDPSQFGATPVDQPSGGFDPSQFGATPVNNSSPTPVSQPSLADQIWGGIVSTGKNYLGQVMPAARDVMGGGNIGAAATQMSKGGLGNIAAGVEKATLGTASDAVQAVFAPITAPIQTLIQHTAEVNAKNPSPLGAGGLTDEQKAQLDSSKQMLTSWAQQHPDIAQTLSDAFNVGTAVVGSDALNKPISEVASNLKSSTSNAVSNVKNTFKGNPEGALQGSIQDVMPLQDKSTRISELESTLPSSSPGRGGVKRSGILGKSTPQPSPIDVARGEAAHPYISTSKDPLEKIANVNQGIRDTSHGVDTFLDQNSSPANFADMRDYIEANNTPSVNLQKDSTAFQAFQRSNESALSTLYKTMKDTASKTGDFGEITPGSDIRQARIAIDRQIKAELGEEVFGSPQYKGIKAAETNVRNIMNRMSEDMLRYPGQLENLNRFNADKSALIERGIEVTPEAETALKEKYGLTSTPETEAAAQQLAAQHEKMSHLFDARDNLINKYQASVGKNKFQELMKNNPVLRKILKYGLITGGAAVIGHEI